MLLDCAQTPADLAAMLDSRLSGLPLEHILGWADFCGLRMVVAPGVFVPRRRTEFLVRQAAALAGPAAVIVDLCCGSGAVGVALLSAIPRGQLYSVDIDPAAVRCAANNVAAVGGRVFRGDLFGPLPAELRGRVDILVANAPYVPTEAIAMMPPEARLYEARTALDGGRDGLDVQRRVVAGALVWLAPGGHLLIETSERQAAESAAIFSRNGLIPHVTRCPDLDATVVIGSVEN